MSPTLRTFPLLLTALLAACAPPAADDKDTDSEVVPSETDEQVVDTRIDDTELVDTEVIDTDTDVVVDTEVVDTDTDTDVTVDTDTDLVLDTEPVDSDTTPADTDTTPVDTDTTPPDSDSTPVDTEVVDTDTTPVDPDADADGFPASVDCDDADRAVFPGAAERCNGRDDDCDGGKDEDAVDRTAYFLDRDLDGQGDPAAPVLACTRPNGAEPDADDCDDTDRTVYLGAPETCDGEDDDCDGVIDDSPTDGFLFFPDLDGDGYGTATGAVRACTTPPGTSPQPTDCDDTRASVHPGEPEVCDGVDQDCDSFVDEGAIDRTIWHPDGDGDGYGSAASSIVACTAPPGALRDGTDCDDAAGSVHPGAAEVCDGKDQDCDLVVDEDATDARAWHVDADRDGYGAPDDVVLACTLPSGAVADASDCDDTRAAVNPAAAETCATAYDDDCDGEANEPGTADLVAFYVDGDGDGFGAGVAGSGCVAPPGTSRQGGDCDDARSGVFPGAPETCDDVDQDCDGSLDEDATDRVTTFVDADGDGFGDPAAPVVACDPPADTVADATDCDDGDDLVYPGADEVCDDLDDDCDGEVDEDAVDADPWYPDADADGYGDGDVVLWSCDPLPGTLASAGDCDDGDAAVSPGDPERCATAFDDDCDGSVNEADATDVTAWYTDGDGDGWGDGAATVACAAGPDQVGLAGDCDDAAGTTFPNAPERCNEVDDDCDGTVDDDALDVVTLWIDADHDGYGDPAREVVTCDPPADAVDDATDCDDARADVHPLAAEVCDDVDQDCDGAIDEGATDAVTWYVDVDNDTYGVAAGSVVACDAPATGTWATRAGDCRDNNVAVNPGAPEVCSTLLDDDCDGTINEASAIDAPTWRLDADADNFGAGTGIVSCTPVTGRVSGELDCDDTQKFVYPGAIELCDGQRNDCRDTSWAASKEDAKVSLQTPQGNWSDITSRFTGTYVLPSGTVWACPGTYTVRVSSSSFQSTSTLAGRGTSSSVILDAGPLVSAGTLGPVLYVGGNAMTAVTVRDVTLRGGSSTTTGGGVDVATGRLTLQRVVVRDNVATTQGGGVCVRTQAELALDAVQLLDNAAGADGGGAWVADTATFSLTNGSVVRGNTAVGRGGGVFLQTPFRADFADTVFDDNRAGSHGGHVYGARWHGSFVRIDLLNGVSGGDGGGLWMSQDSGQSVTFVDVLADGNEAANDGGGLWVSSNNGLTLTGLTATSNTAAMRGGGVYVTSGLNIGLVDPVITGNLARSQGGGLYALGVYVTVDGATISANRAQVDGGGLFVRPERFWLTDSVVDANVVYGTGGTSYRGAGMYSSGPWELVVRDTDFTDNTFTAASGTEGGGAFVAGAGATFTRVFVGGNVATRGGGLLASAGVTAGGTANTFTLDDVLVEGNRASQGGGAYVSSGNLACLGSILKRAGFLGNVATSLGAGGGVHLPTYDTQRKAGFQASACDFGVASSTDDNFSGASLLPSADVRAEGQPTTSARGDDVSMTCTGPTYANCLL